MPWDDWSTPLQKSDGAGAPDIPDDVYDARILDVSELTTGPDMFNEGQDKTQFYVNLELLSDDLDEGTTLRYYITLSEQMRQGYIHEKSKLYALLNALGYDMDGELPPISALRNDLIDQRLRVTVKNPVDGGWPKISDLMRARQRTRKEPVAAGSAKPTNLRARLDPDGE